MKYLIILALLAIFSSNVMGFIGTTTPPETDSDNNNGTVNVTERMLFFPFMQKQPQGKGRDKPLPTTRCPLLFSNNRECRKTNNKDQSGKCETRECIFTPTVGYLFPPSYLDLYNVPEYYHQHPMISRKIVSLYSNPYPSFGNSPYQGGYYGAQQQPFNPFSHMLEQQQPYNPYPQQQPMNPYGQSYGGYDQQQPQYNQYDQQQPQYNQYGQQQQDPYYNQQQQQYQQTPYNPYNQPDQYSNNQGFQGSMTGYDPYQSQRFGYQTYNQYQMPYNPYAQPNYNQWNPYSGQNQNEKRRPAKSDNKKQDKEKSKKKKSDDDKAPRARSGAFGMFPNQQTDYYSQSTQYGAPPMSYNQPPTYSFGAPQSHPGQYGQPGQSSNSLYNTFLSFMRPQQAHNSMIVGVLCRHANRACQCNDDESCSCKGRKPKICTQIYEDAIGFFPVREWVPFTPAPQEPIPKTGESETAGQSSQSMETQYVDPNAPQGKYEIKRMRLYYKKPSGCDCKPLKTNAASGIFGTRT